MKVKHGSNRTVIVFSYFVFKIARIQAAKEILLSSGRLDNLFSRIKLAFRDYYKGIKENINEYECWKSCGKSFLAPTICTLGFLNIQRKIEGEKPSKERMIGVMKRLNEKTDGYVGAIDPHCLLPKNFKETSNGLVIIDYGDSGSGLLFSEFIKKWENELESVLTDASRSK